MSGIVVEECRRCVELGPVNEYGLCDRCERKGCSNCEGPRNDPRAGYCVNGVVVCNAAFHTEKPR